MLTEVNSTSALANVTNAVIGTVTNQANILAAPGAGLRYRIFSCHAVADQANTGKIDIRLVCGIVRPVLALSAQQTGDHCVFNGNAGLILPANTAINFRDFASVATQTYGILLIYVIESAA